MTLVDKDPQKDIYVDCRVPPEKIKELANDFVRNAAAAIIVTYSAVALVRSVTNIAEIIVKAKLK